MVRIGKFEVSVLTSTDSQVKNPEWVPAQEHTAQNIDTYKKGNYSVRYIAASRATDFEGNRIPTAFAIHFKLHGPLSKSFMKDADIIVFRVFHDNKRIGSSHVKRKDWERGVTYSVRKSSRRYWLEDEGRWLRMNWHFDEGLHGTLKIQVWRQVESQPHSGAWDAALDLPTKSYGDEEYIDYNDPVVGTVSSNTRVRFTQRAPDSDIPEAEFVFEYRPDDTMKTIGIITAPAMSIPTVPASSFYDLTQDDDLRAEDLDLHPIYYISDSSVASPTKTVYSNYTSDDFWGNSPVPCSNNLDTTDPVYQRLTLGMPNSLLNQNVYPGDFYGQNYESNGFTISHAQQGSSSTPLQLQTHKQRDVVDLTEED